MTRVIALACTVALLGPVAHASPRPYEGPLATAEPGELGPDAPPVAASAPAPVPRAAPRVGPDSLPPPQRRPPMVVAGVATICVGIGGYVAMVVGLGLGANADAQLVPLGARAEIPRRREVLDQGQLGNNLAIGFGVAAAVAIATGIALVVVGRRRANMTAPQQRRR